MGQTGKYRGNIWWGGGELNSKYAAFYFFPGFVFCFQIIPVIMKGAVRVKQILKMSGYDIIL